MALIIEDGTGVLDANSYVTLVETQDYFTERGIDPASITEADLINATTFIDLTYGTGFRGSMVDTTQSLLFPRTAFVDGNGRTIDHGTIPRDLKIATYHAARVSSQGTQLIANANPMSNVESYTKSVDGVVSKSEKFFSPINRTETQFIGTYIRPLLRAGSGSSRTVRA
jgi:hypothetical protein